jgi:hypothetical protein
MIITQHNDNLRSGLNSSETTLNTTNVADSAQFGKLFEIFVDGSIYAQPLIAPGLQIPDHDQPLDVVFIATMHNSVYAFDASSGNLLWHQSLADSLQLPASDVGPSGYRDIVWEVGIVGTPVIDTSRPALYVVTTSRNNGAAIHQLWKLNISNGTLMNPAPIPIQSTLSNTFTSSKQLQRPALTLANNKVYIAFGSYGDNTPYNGWLFAYDADSLIQTNVFVSTPSGTKGGIWQAGQGPAIDDAGDLYFMTGNGSFDPTTGDYGDSVVKLDGNLNFVDFFSPYNNAELTKHDWDLGSSGVLLIPNTNLCIGGGKTAILYLMSRTDLGKYNKTTDNVLQEVSVGARTKNHIHGSPVYYAGPNGVDMVYVWCEMQNLKAFSLDNTNQLLNVPPASESNVSDPDGVAGGNNGMPGGFLSVSSNGTESGTGILWANHPFSGDANQEVRPGILRAFDAMNLSLQLWNSRLEPVRDDLGNLAKFCPPTIYGGKVYQATMGGLQQIQQTTELTRGTPAFANQNNQRLVVAWTGTDSELNIMTSLDGLLWDPSSTKFTIPGELASYSPGLAFDTTTGTTFISWIGTDGELNIAQSTAANLDSWTNPHVTGEKSDHGVALAFSAPHLFVAWTGTDKKLNVASSINGGSSWDKKVILDEKSNAKPYLVVHKTNNSLALAWQGTDKQLNFAECDFSNLAFRPKTIIGELTEDPPALDFGVDGLPWVSWTGTDGHLNMVVANGVNVVDIDSGANRKRIMYQNFASAAPALCLFQGKMVLTWENNTGSWLYMGVLNRGSVAVYGLFPPVGR